MMDCIKNRQSQYRPGYESLFNDHNILDDHIETKIKKGFSFE